MIIGLTGRNGSGKGEVAKFLQEAGFQFYSLSDIIREEIRKKGKKVTRERLIETGTGLREKEGPGVLAERTLAKLSSDRNYVVDSIRNPEEVRVLKRRSDFYLLKVTAPRSVRFRRTKARGRENDTKSLKDFIRLEEKEFRSHNPASQQLLKTEKLVDHARVVSLRSNCVKRRVAAVLVKDRRIISSGYNGTPRGVKNCSEGGCPRCNSFGSSGAKLDECFCSHAEENAITQSAYHGVNIQSATLYTTFSPCLMCTKMIINSGIAEVVYDAHYPLASIAMRLLKEAGVKTRKFGTKDE